jgi:hypothetical protein
MCEVNSQFRKLADGDTGNVRRKVVPVIPRVSARPSLKSNFPPISVRLVGTGEYRFDSRAYRRLLGAVGALIVRVVRSPGGDVRFRLLRKQQVSSEFGGYT